MPDRRLPSQGPGGSLRLRLLGEARAAGETDAQELGPGKPLALLAFLHCRGGRASRANLCELLWFHLQPEAQRHALRQALWFVRQRLGEAVLAADATDVQLVASASSDRGAFLDAVDSGDHARAASLYGGDFLPSFALPGAYEFEDWAEQERTRLRTAFLRVSEQLVREQLGAGRFREAITTARRAREAAPHGELAWRLILESLLAARDDVQAALEADALEQMLRTDGHDPEAPTRTLLRLARQTARAADPQSPSRPSLVPELVGRASEFSMLTAAWEDVRRGVVRTCVLIAPPGLGKSRLLTDLASRLGAGRALVRVVRAAYGDREVAFGLAASLVAGLAELPGARSVSTETAAALVALNPTLSSLFSARVDEATGDEALRRRRLAVAELVACVSAEQPVALLVDDLQWADAASLHVIRAIWERPPGTRLLLACTVRDASTVPFGVDGMIRIHLDPLSVEEVTELIGSLAALPQAPWAEALPRRLWETTGGSPLLILEELRHLLERGTLALGQASWHAAMPDRLLEHLGRESVITRRLSELEPGARDVLLTLSAAGRPVDASALAAANRLEDATLARVLSDLELRGMVSCDGADWRLSHDEIGVATLAAADPTARRRAEQALGEALAVSAVTMIDLARAVRLLASTGDMGWPLRTAFRRAWELEREQRSTTNPEALAREMLGPMANPALVAHLVRALPWRFRPGALLLRGAVAALLLLLTGGYIGRRLLARESAPLDAQLLVLLLDSAGTARVLPVWLSRDSVAEQARPIELDPDRALDAPVLLAQMRQGDRMIVRMGDTALYSRSFPDTHDAELVMATGESGEIRLTTRPRDDESGDLSPDGTQIAFQSGFWDPADHRLQLALLRLRDRRVVRLTYSKGRDADPLFSPEGSRVAFLRRDGGLATQLCVVRVDDSRESCQALPLGEVRGMWTWRSMESVLLALQSEQTERVYECVLGGSCSLTATLPLGATPDPALHYSIQRDSLGHLGVAPLAADAAARQLRVVKAGWRIARLRWARPSPRHASPLLEVHPRAESLAVGRTARLATTGRDRLGRPLVGLGLTWESLDTAVAVVEPSGVVVARTVGTARIAVRSRDGAGDTARVTVVSDRNVDAPTLLQETWTDWPSPRFRLYGDPRPIRVMRPDGGWAFFHHGDESYGSGAYSAQRFSASRGLGVEFVAFTPVRAVKWQSLSLVLHDGIDEASLSRWDHLTGSLPFEGATDIRLCALSIPSEEGAARREQLSLDVGADLRIPLPRVRDDTSRWVRYRLQLMPDGQCALAIDGRPVARGRVGGPASRPFRLVISGYSVGTRILVGPVTVWEGVRPGVDWHALDAQEARKP